MGLRINTNMAAVNANRNLRVNQSGLQGNFEKLSSSKRINKSADDAAGLAISENLNAQIRSFGQANRNAQDGISFVQVAEGGMAEVTNMVTRIRELSVQAASDTVGQAERQYLNQEAQQLKLEIERVAQNTKYNGSNLLNGSGSKLEFQIGTGSSEFLDRIGYDPSKTNVSLEALGLTSIDIGTKEAAQQGLSALDKSFSVVNGNRATLGALQSRLNSTINNLEVAVENFSAAKSRILDADYGDVSANLAKESVKAQASTAVLGQANSQTSLALKLLG